MNAATNTSAMSTLKAVWDKCCASSESNSRTSIAVVKENDNWFLYTLLDDGDFACPVHGEKLFRITEEDVDSIRKEICKKSSVKQTETQAHEFAFTRSIKGDVTVVVVASTDGSAVFDVLVKDNIPASSITIYTTREDVSQDVLAPYNEQGFQTKMCRDKEVVENNITKVLNIYREKITGCPLAN